MNLNFKPSLVAPPTDNFATQEAEAEGLPQGPVWAIVIAV